MLNWYAFVFIIFGGCFLAENLHEIPMFLLPGKVNIYSYDAIWKLMVMICFSYNLREIMWVGMILLMQTFVTEDPQQWLCSQWQACFLLFV